MTTKYLQNDRLQILSRDLTVFFLSFRYLTLSQSSFTLLLRTFLYIKEESVRGVQTVDTERRKNFISLSSFLPIIAFLDKFIVSSASDGVVPCYHQCLQETNKFPPFLRVWSPNLKTAQMRESWHI